MAAAVKNGIDSMHASMSPQLSEILLTKNIALNQMRAFLEAEEEHREQVDWVLGKTLVTDGKVQREGHFEKVSVIWNEEVPEPTDQSPHIDFEATGVAETLPGSCQNMAAISAIFSPFWLGVYPGGQHVIKLFTSEYGMGWVV